MESFSVLHAGAVVGGLLLTAAIAYAIYKFTPTPYRNLFFGFIALGMFAVGTGSKIDVSMNRGEGLVMKVAELEKTIEAQKAQIAALEKRGVPTEQIVTLVRNQEQDLKKLLNAVAYLDTTVKDQRQQLASAQKRYDTLWAALSRAGKIEPASGSPAVSFEPNKWKQLGDLIQANQDQQ